MYNTVIFDIDGTIADTSQGVIDAVKFTINKFRLKELDQEELRKFAGYSPLKKGFLHFCNVDDDMANLCCETYRQYYKEKSIQLSRIYDGIIPLLDLLKSRNCKLGIATFKNEENARLLLKELGIDKYFGYVSGANYEKSQTKSDILKKCLQELKSKAKETIFIGDSQSDAQASKEAKCAFIGVTYGLGFSSDVEVTAYKPLLVANSILDIIEFINCL